MKLILNELDNKILFKTNKDIKSILVGIKKDIWNSNILYNNKRSKEFWTDHIIDDVINLDIYSRFDIEYNNNIITIWGDDGLLEFRILEIDNINNL